MKIQWHVASLASISIAAGVILGIGYVNAQSKVNAKDTQLETDEVKVSGSVAVVYQSMGQMAAAADVIVTGTFTGEKLVVQRSIPIDYPPRASGNSPAPLRDPKLIDQIELGHLDSAFNVSEVIKGRAVSKLYIAQSGLIAATPSASKPVLGDSFFKGGNSYILFLKKPQAHEIKNAGGRSFYYTIGAYQGGHRIKNGKVYTRDIEDLDSTRLSKAPDNEGYGYRINGADLNSVLRDLKIQTK